MITPSRTAKAASAKRSKRSQPSSAKSLKRRNTLPLAIRRFAKAQKLWEPGDSILLAVSGGPDSVALLHILSALSAKDGLQLKVAHVNYQLRGEDSEKDSRFVQALAESYGLPCFVLRSSAKPQKNIEAALRDIRYAFFRRTAAKEGCRWIALGHQQDDQAETFLLRLLRGSGAEGLGAMRPKDGMLIRPFLATSRKALLAYLEAYALDYRLDKSNESGLYFRNRIRHELLPLLEKDFQPNIKAVLARTALLLAEAVQPKLSLINVPVAEKRDERTFSLHALSSLEESLFRDFLRLVLKDLLPYAPSQALLKEIAQTLRSTKNKTQKMAFHGLKLERKGDRVTLRKILY